jgi:hypothetical protein
MRLRGSERPGRGERVLESEPSFLGRAEAVRPLDQPDPPMALVDQEGGRVAHRLAVVRRDQVIGIVELGRAHAHVANPELVTQRGERVVLRDRRQQHDSEQSLALEELAQVVDHPEELRSTGRTTIANSVPCSPSRIPCCTLSTICAFGLSWIRPIRKLRRRASARACGLGT